MPSGTPTAGDSNGYKQLAVALALGLLGGAGGTYKIADDYNRDITALKVEAASTECKMEILIKKLELGYD